MSDLLSSPKLKALANRLNPAAVFNTARGVLEEVAAEAKNVATERRMPDISELSERIAAKLRTTPFAASLPQVNATGILFPAEIACSELPVKAIDRMVASFGGEFSAMQPETPTAAQPDAMDASQSARKPATAREMICELTGAADAVIVNAHAAALLLAFATLSRHDRPDVLTTPGDLYETMSGCRIDDIIPMTGCEALTVGSLPRATLDDYAAAAGDETACVYCADGIDGCLAVERNLPELSQLVDFARKRNLPLVFDTEWGTFQPTHDYGLKGVPTCRDLLQQGVSLLVASCGGLNGCDFAAASPGDNDASFPPELMRRRAPAIIAGDKSLIREIRKSPLFPMFLPSRHDLAALEAVLDLMVSRDTAENELPLWQLLSTDNENLKLRADRMAMQIAVLPGVTDACVVSSPAHLTPLRPRHVLPSQEVRVTFASKTAVEMLAALASYRSEQGRTGIAATFVPDQPNTIAINLRTVFARYDMLIVEALTALTTDPASPPEAE